MQSHPWRSSDDPCRSVRIIRATRWLAVALLLVAAPAAQAQLTLRDALREADEAAYANRAAAGVAVAQDAQKLAPLEGIVPSLRVEAGHIRTTDPIGAFGITLRQRAVTPAAFEPRHLNDPRPVGDYQGGIVAEVPLVNLDAWVGRRAGARAGAAGAAAAEWTRLATRTAVIRAYYGAALAAGRVATIEATARAAHAHVAQARAMVSNGLVTKADALLASVRAADVDAKLAEARGDAATTLAALATLLGRERGSVVSAPAALPASARIREVVGPDTALEARETRSDVRAASLASDAAGADARRARATSLPRVNAVARIDWHSAARPYGGARSWTLAVMATWSLFDGARTIAAARAADGRAAAALAEAEGAAANARLQADQTRIALGVALARLAIAEQAVAQSAEAHRLVEKRYGGGLATVAELLDAQATATQSALALAEARYMVIAAAAEHRQALGADPGALVSLDDEPAALTAISPQ